jgi:glycosyltransferase involved in cell wall biosynthesis
VSRPLHILQVTKSTGGVAEYVRWLAQGLDRAQFELTVACLSEGGAEFASELAHAGLSAFSLAMDRYRISLISDSRVALSLAKIIRHGNFDLIHAHASKPGFLARLAALGSGIPVIYSPHCFSFHAGTGRFQAGLLAAAERLAARYMTARILTVAEGEQTLASSYRVGRPGQFVTVHSGIDLPAYDRPINRAALKAGLEVPQAAFLVGAVGRLSRQKAPQDFVQMAALIHKQLSDVHFIWIGSGPDEVSLRQLRNELGLEGVLHFAGQRTDTPALLKVLDCFVLPSLWEGFPIVLLEAMAANVPIVATQIPGNDEAIRSGMDGWLVPPHEPAALAQAVEDVLCNPQRAESFRLSGRRRVEREFTRQAMLDGVMRLYGQVSVERQGKLLNPVLRGESQ